MPVFYLNKQEYEFLTIVKLVKTKNTIFGIDMEFTTPIKLQVKNINKMLFNSIQFSRSVVSDSLQPHGLQHARLPCPSPTPRAWSNSCQSSR